MSQRRAQTLGVRQVAKRLMFYGCWAELYTPSQNTGTEVICKVVLSFLHWLWPSAQGIISLQALQQALKWLKRKLPVYMIDQL